MEKLKLAASAEAQPQVEESQQAPTPTVQDRQDTIPAREEAEPADGVTVPVKFNHVRRNLSLAEAATLAQKGMQAEAFMPKLRYLAAVGNQSIAQVVDALYNREQEQARQELMAKVQDEELVETLMESRNIQAGKAYEALLAAEAAGSQQEDEARLAREWEELKNAVPTLQSLPAEAEQIAREQGVALLDGYLRFQLKEAQRVAKAAQQEALAAGRSAGSQKSTAVDGGADISAMLRGVWSR